MRRFLATVLVTVMTMAGAPLGARASQQDLITLKGRAFTTRLQAFPDARVQIRDLKTGLLVNSTTTNPTGEFAFENLKPGDYILVPCTFRPGIRNQFSLVGKAVLAS